jgi:hypothetical protein
MIRDVAFQLRQSKPLAKTLGSINESSVSPSLTGWFGQRKGVTMTFQAPTGEHKFILSDIVGLDSVTATDRFSETTPDLVDAILSEAGKLSDDVLAPLNPIGDANPAKLENGVVRTPPGFAEGFRAIADGDGLV